MQYAIFAVCRRPGFGFCAGWYRTFRGKDAPAGFSESWESCARVLQILQSYARYYNDIRTHRSLDKDAPVSRQIQRIGSIKSHAILGGFHHHYARA